MFDYCLINNSEVSDEALEKYAKDGAVPVAADTCQIEKMGVCPVFANVAGYSDSFFRHNPWLLAAEIMKLYNEKSETKIFK